ncbi:site-specific DNA-methyltransferase [Flavobacterium alkalisoli]|uniref:site-specific DNA-methyltransferase (adenine-specific) n=1 Tax=Flavobacterium alkalisoli TaxID=2602769 RepID=A0A5B9FUW4_9FLAO|nr:site-specific DNA-methyltransferase [Flavobacterium alkalisoli]QEE50704.1 site-specific DNA-methyltransferase [Flavobacterium alkalisoli]
MEQIKNGNELTKSLDIVNENISRLKELFPEVVTEGKIDFKVLQDILGNEIEEGEEYYRFTWAGKAQARREAHKPSTGTLRPAKEESVDWDTTQNLYIEGDNLEVLKLLQKSYAGKVKMIYIDPPYNTGKDFVYKDNYKDNLKNYQQVTGQVDDVGNKLTTNSENDGRYHSNWLNMMYPRLLLARNILKEDGVIFISIDEIENSKLRIICDEIFGESNHIADFVWQNKKGGGNDAKYVAVEHEYVIMYCKNETALHDLFEPYKPEYLKRYKEEDEKGKYFWDTFKRKSGKQFYSITCPDGSILEFDDLGNRISWLRSEERFLQDLSEGEVRFVQNKGVWNVHFKQRLPKGKKPRTIFLRNSIWSELGTNSDGSNSIKKLFGKEVFSHPKPLGLIKELLGFSLQTGDIVLDFFSGSATTFQAGIEFMLEQGLNLKFICIQLPEDIDSKSEEGKNAISLGYKKITDIAKDRIKKVYLSNQDYKTVHSGFKVLKLDSSNIKGWDGNPENLEQNLFDSQDNIKTDRTEEDVLFEILLKYGLDLTLPIEENLIEGKNVFSVGYGALFICLADNITNKVAEGIGKWKEELNPEVCRVIFKDSGFTDVEKTNAVQTLKRFGINEIKSI